MRQTRHQAPLLFGISSTNRRPNRGDKPHTFDASSRVDQEEHQGMGAMLAHRRVRLQPRKTFDYRQVPLRGRLRLQPVAPLDILPLPIQERINMDTSARASYLKKVHEDTRATIERQVHRLTTKINVNKAPMVFQPGDLVWLHLRKDRFPHERKSKLLPRADGPFKVLARYNDNAYKIDIPRDKYPVSDTFNIKDLSPFHGDEDFDPRSDLSQGRGDDTVYPRAITMDPPSPPQVPQGPMTRARAKAFETEVTSLLALLPYESCETWLLPQASVLCVLRCEGDHFGEELEDGQVPKVVDEPMHREEQKRAPGPGHPAPWPGHPAPGRSATEGRVQQKLQGPDIRPGPGHPAKHGPDIRPRARKSGASVQRAPETRPLQPGHPAPRPGRPAPLEDPDIRAAARTSGP